MRTSLSAWIGQALLRGGAGILVRSRIDVEVAGVEHIPRHGPVLIVSRHYHHLYDGAIFLAVVPRPVHFLVGLDWIRSPRIRLAMEVACRVARWPIVIRTDSPLLARGSAYRLTEAIGLLRRAVRDMRELLLDGEVLVIFPEGYPGIDPSYSPKTDPDEFLPFRSGFAKLVAEIQRRSGLRVPVVPAGLEYRWPRPWRVHLAFGDTLYLENPQESISFGQRIAAEVIRLSRTTAADRG